MAELSKETGWTFKPDGWTADERRWAAELERRQVRDASVEREAVGEPPAVRGRVMPQDPPPYGGRLALAACTGPVVPYRHATHPPPLPPPRGPRRAAGPAQARRPDRRGRRPPQGLPPRGRPQRPALAVPREEGPVASTPSTSPARRRASTPTSRACARAASVRSSGPRTSPSSTDQGRHSPSGRRSNRSTSSTAWSSAYPRRPSSSPRTADDIVRIRKAGKIASLIGVEGGH